MELLIVLIALEVTNYNAHLRSSQTMTLMGNTSVKGIIRLKTMKRKLLKLRYH